jgi:hypothetical protein
MALGYERLSLRRILVQDRDVGQRVERPNNTGDIA